MNVWSIVVVALFLIGACVALGMYLDPKHAADDEGLPERLGDPAGARPAGGLGDLAGAERIIAKIMVFFGIYGAPLYLAVAVLLSTAAIACGTLDVIATLHLGTAYPSWFPAVATSTGLWTGLLSCRALSGPPGTSGATPGAEQSDSF